jgi:cell wall-associated NlpC family hydrolase
MNPITATIDHNEIVVILEKTSSEWYHINYHGSEGYVAAMYLTDVLTAENFNATGTVTGDDVLFRSTPSTSGSLLGSCDAGTTIKIIGINSGWYKVQLSGKTGYIRSDFITIISDSTANAASAVAGVSDAQNVTQISDEQLTLRQQLIKYALQYVGYNYVYGGSSPSSGFDCSGFVYYVFHHYDYNVTRTASSQYSQDGSGILKSELEPGDLVFFSSNGGYSVTHVGIYIGDNQFVHASTPRVGVVVSRLDSTYYTNVWYGAKRILP